MLPNGTHFTGVPPNQTIEHSDRFLGLLLEALLGVLEVAGVGAAEVGAGAALATGLGTAEVAGTAALAGGLTAAQTAAVAGAVAVGAGALAGTKPHDFGHSSGYSAGSAQGLTHDSAVQQVTKAFETVRTQVDSHVLAGTLLQLFSQCVINKPCIGVDPNELAQPELRVGLLVTKGSCPESKISPYTTDALFQYPPLSTCPSECCLVDIDLLPKAICYGVDSLNYARNGHCAQGGSCGTDEESLSHDHGCRDHVETCCAKKNQVASMMG